MPFLLNSNTTNQDNEITQDNAMFTYYNNVIKPFNDNDLYYKNNVTQEICDSLINFSPSDSCNNNSFNDNKTSCINYALCQNKTIGDKIKPKQMEHNTADEN